MLKVLFFSTLFINFICAFLLRDPVSLKSHQFGLLGYTPTYQWTEEWYQGMPIDHFSFADSRDFQLRFLI